MGSLFSRITIDHKFAIRYIECHYAPGSIVSGHFTAAQFAQSIPIEYVLIVAQVVADMCQCPLEIPDSIDTGDLLLKCALPSNKAIEMLIKPILCGECE